MPEVILRRRLELFPLSTEISHSAGISTLTIAGCDLISLADQFGTPLYLFDRYTLDYCVAEYRRALQLHYPGESGVTYAGKAFLCTALVQWSRGHDLWLDCTGTSEIAIAAAGGASRSNILVHGVNKSLADLTSAWEQAGTIVIDNLTELERLVTLAQRHGSMLPNLWLRLRPGLAVETHAYTQTGQVDSKFGMDFTEAAHAVEICILNGLPLTGLHFHQGSHFDDPAPLAPAIQQILDLVASLRSRFGWLPQTLCPGGGWGVAYHEDDLPQPSIYRYVRFIAEILVAACQEREIPLPRLQLEPGRSLVARAGVGVYRVGAIKHTANRRWILLDGGMADNPRPALYHARYSALPVTQLERPASEAAWLGGPYCESGDVLIEDLPLPTMQPGELIAIPASGAYHLGMGSNYNGALKPAVVWLDAGRSHLIQTRQTIQDLLQRDIPLP